MVTTWTIVSFRSLLAFLPVLPLHYYKLSWFNLNQEGNMGPERWFPREKHSKALTKTANRLHLWLQEYFRFLEKRLLYKRIESAYIAYMCRAQLLSLIVAFTWATCFLNDIYCNNPELLFHEIAYPSIFTTA